MLKSMAIFYYSKCKKRYLHAYKNVYLWVCTVLTVNEYTRTLLNTCFADPPKAFSLSWVQSISSLHSAKFGAYFT